MANALGPGLAGYYAAEQARNASTGAQISQLGGLLGIQNQLFEQGTRQALAQSGGDPEKAMEIALKSGNVAAAQHLGPLIKMKREKEMQAATGEGMRQIYGLPPSNAVPAPAGTPAPGQPPQMGQGGAALPPQEGQPVPTGPAAGQGMTPQANPKQARIQQLQQMSMLPAYVNDPIVQQRIQAEIDRIDKESKPMVEHNFPIAGGKEPMVQPHISLDNGKTWQPIPGSQPSPKFAKQVVNVNTGGGEPVALTDDTLRMDAFRYLTDGTLPTNMGRGVQGSAQATKIRNEASRIASEELKMPMEDVRMLNLTNKAGVAALMQLGKARAQILQFEKTAEYNLDLAVKASEKVDRTGIPVFNKWLQAGRSEIAGDPDTKVFNAANETFISEYARVMSGGYGAAQTTEGAQSRAHTLLSTAATKEQYRAVTDQLKKEMNNRVRALNTQMDEEKGRMVSGIKPPSAQPTQSTGGWSIVR